MTKQILKKIGKVALDILEFYIPAFFFIVLFVCFLLGIFFRYVLKDPQTWTFELSTVCYLSVGILSWGIAHRTDEHVVFDMLYNKLSPKVQCVLRVISNLVIAVTAALLIEPSISYIQSLMNVSAQTLPIPRGLIFTPFTISYIVAVVRSTCRLIQDAIALCKGSYKQTYGSTEVSK